MIVQHWFTHRVAVLTAFILLIGLIAIGPNSLISRLLSNAGLLALDRSLVQYGIIDRAERVDPDLAKAEYWLRTASDLSAANQGAWRGLGLALTVAGRMDEALAAWINAKATADEFILRGNEARTARQFDPSLDWYKAATALQPELADGWYYQGLAYQDLGDWTAARQSFQRAIQAAAFDLIGHSTRYYHLGMVDRFHTQPPLLNEAADAFTIAIDLNDFNSTYEAADSHYQRGSIVEQSNPSLALQEYRKAIELDPKHSWAHLLLGRLLYRTTRDVSQAESEMYQALSTWPNDATRKWPYRILGDMYREAGQISNARDAYQKALLLDPTDNAVKSILAIISKSN